MLHVEIQLQGSLDMNWTSWLEGFIFTYTEQGETIVTGKVKDQAALYGLMSKLRDLGVKLVAVKVDSVENNHLEDG